MVGGLSGGNALSVKRKLLLKDEHLLSDQAMGDVDVPSAGRRRSDNGSKHLPQETATERAGVVSCDQFLPLDRDDGNVVVLAPGLGGVGDLLRGLAADIIPVRDPGWSQ